MNCIPICLYSLFPRLTHNPSFLLKKPSVGPDYICYYRESPMVHPIEDPVKMEEMWVRIQDTGHNCDTFYFAAIQRMAAVVDFVKNLLRLKDWKILCN